MTNQRIKNTVPITEESLRSGQQHQVGRNFIVKDSGVYHVTEDKKTGKLKPQRIAGPLFLTGTIRNIDENKVHLKLVYKQHQKYFVTDVQGGQIAIPNELVKLNGMGAEIPFEYSKLLVTYLREQEKAATYEEEYSKIGFHVNEQKDWEYRHAEIIPARKVKTTYSKNGAIQLIPKGSLEAWIDMVRQEVVGYAPLEFMVAVGFTAPLVGYLSQVIKTVQTLFINLNTASSVGKTTSAMLAASVFWNSDLNAPNSLIQNWSGTSNSIIESFNGNYGIPVVLDEISMNDDKELSSMFYAIVSGKGKGRLTDLIQQREKATWATTIISTGEVSAFLHANENSGIKVRVKEFVGIQWTKSSDNADAILATIHDNYGHPGIAFVNHMFTVGLPYVEQVWSDWLGRVKIALPDSPFRERVSKDYAVIMTAVTLANEAFDLGLSETKILSFIVTHEETASLTRDTGNAAYEKMKQVFIEHQANFRHEGQLSPPQVCWGKLIDHPDKVEFAVLRHVMEQQLKTHGFQNTRTVLNGWQQSGVLNAEGDRKSRRVAVYESHEQKERQQALGKQPPKKLEDTTYNLMIPKEELDGLLGRRRVVKDEIEKVPADTFFNE